ncbi:MAG: hypothetical protein P9L90_05965 [Candidatus Aadella gelida]|nr:hypothetical protein [Candidatus Aadella gelida]
MKKIHLSVLILVVLFLTLHGGFVSASAKILDKEEMHIGALGKVTGGEGIQRSDIFYAITEDGLYKTEDAGKNWERVILPPGVAEINDITVTKQRVFIAASSGVYTKEGNKEWERILGKETIKGVVAGEDFGDDVDASTGDESGVKIDVTLNKQKNAEGEDIVWVTAGGDLNRISSNKKEDEEKYHPKKLHNEHQITIREVQEMAVEYAEVSPDKIKRWREGARWKAFLPRLSLSFSESTDENVEIYKSATTSYVVSGPIETDNDWGVDLTWDLSDIIWNDVQTSIDVRSKLMVQLREDILEEVTRLYFERKRMIADASILEGKGVGTDEKSNKMWQDKMLRAEEITGYIDALTGGKFSNKLRSEMKT